MKDCMKDYIKDLLYKDKPTQSLRSVFGNNQIISKTRLSVSGDKAFSAITPKLRNSNCLPLELKNANSYVNFKAALKTFLFRKAY